MRPVDTSTAAAGFARVVAAFSAVATVAQQIAYPLVDGHAEVVLTIGSVVTFFAASCAHAFAVTGWRGLGALVVVCSGGGLAAEAIGIRTGWPFGRYAYTGSLGLQLFGVPVVVAMAWAMMGWPALLAGRRVGPAAPLFGALILAAWDLFLDPQMVRDGHWRWLPTSWPKLHGIPLSNTIGWFAVALTMLALLDRLVPHVRNPSPLALSVPFALLGWTWFSETFGHLVFFRRPSVAMVGGIAMGLALVPVIRGRSLGQGRAQSAGGKP